MTHQFSTNTCILKKPEKEKYKWYKHDLMTNTNHLKYKQFVENMDSHFARAKITNFNIIHHQCQGDPLQNSLRYYETIFDNDFKNYEDRPPNQAISSAVKADRNDIHFECNLLKSHIKSDIEKDLISNGIFIRKSRKKRDG